MFSICLDLQFILIFYNDVLQQSSAWQRRKLFCKEPEMPSVLLISILCLAFSPVLSLHSPWWGSLGKRKQHSCFTVIICVLGLLWFPWGAQAGIFLCFLVLHEGHRLESSSSSWCHLSQAGEGMCWWLLGRSQQGPEEVTAVTAHIHGQPGAPGNPRGV